MKPSCPSTTELNQLLIGDLSDTQQQECAQHLDQCECCQTKLEELATGGTNLSQLVEKLNEAEPVAESAYWPAIRAIHQAGGQSVAQVAAMAPTLAPPSP